MRDEYVLVTAARNEQDYIAKTIESVIAQTILPRRWVIVSDGSTDRTDAIVAEYAARHRFIELLRLEPGRERDFACQVYGQHAGAERCRDIEYDFIGMLDADISFGPDYYEKILTEFERRPTLGLAGGVLYDLYAGQWIRQKVNLSWNVSGPVQMFRRQVFEQIGGYIPMKSGGQDVIAEVMTRMHGWDVRSFPQAPVLHYRPTGACCGNPLLRTFRFGVREYIWGTHPLFEIVKCLSRAMERPYGVGSLARLLGYFWAFAKREPRDVPAQVRKYLRKEQLHRLSTALRKERSTMSEQGKRTFWFDLETAPDVLFFEPMVKRIRERGHTVHVSCRDYSDVPELAQLYGIGGTTLGKHGGKSKAGKILAGLVRSVSMARWARRKNIDLAIGFGSRPLTLAAARLGIPSVSVFDYEHGNKGRFGSRLSSWTFVPPEVSAEYLEKKGIPTSQLIRYPGLKEEVYTGVYQYHPGLLKQLGYDEKKTIVTIRPPATKATYHNSLSDLICRQVLQQIVSNRDVLAIFLRRDGDATFDEFLKYENVRNLTVPVKGLDLIIESDLVISGGGTMVREAAALGIPAYSIFAGAQGAVDARLDREGRLTLVRTVEDVAKIRFAKRDRQQCTHVQDDSVLEFFVREFIRLAGGTAEAAPASSHSHRQPVHA